MYKYIKPVNVYEKEVRIQKSEISRRAFLFDVSHLTFHG